jgi:hypothetical protein
MGDAGDVIAYVAYADERRQGVEVGLPGMLQCIHAFSAAVEGGLKSLSPGIRAAGNGGVTFGELAGF